MDTISLFKAWLGGARSPLARRFVYLTILCSSVLAVLMTTIQLTIDYVNDRSELYASPDKLELSTLPSLAESLWVIDVPVVQSQLEGIVQLEGMTYAELNYDSEQLNAGNQDLKYSSQHHFPVKRSSEQGVFDLGMLTIRLSHEKIKTRVLRRAIVVLLTNLVKTAIVAAIVLLIYQQLIGRHLTQLAVYAKAYSPGSSSKTVVLKRRTVDPALEDELAILARAMSDQALTIDSIIHQLRDTNRSQAEFTYALSHDLKSPTNTLHMLLHEFREVNTDELNEDSVNILNHLDSTVTRMSRLIEDVLTYSRSVDVDMLVEDIDLKAEIEEIVKIDLLGDIANTDAEIRIGALPKVTGNVGQLRLLFQNLISNAIKFCDSERKPVVVVEGVPIAESGLISVSVKDNGIGIDERYQDRIFGLFKRLHSHTQYQGSGIGLSICQRVISNHGGWIKVVSEEGAGSTFIVALPEKSVEKNVIPIDERSEQLASI
ncbi:hypothetical protein AB833_31350 [Chromatiales bacterium (ex Bugula neritina AB1)]|nr:hypothetical protein AB833_31350 [Chromatiales bacterium (ex Bugula neritina AB1)]